MTDIKNTTPRRFQTTERIKLTLEVNATIIK